MKNLILFFLLFFMFLQSIYSESKWKKLSPISLEPVPYFSIEDRSKQIGTINPLNQVFVIVPKDKFDKNEIRNETGVYIKINDIQYYSPFSHWGDYFRKNTFLSPDRRFYLEVWSYSGYCDISEATYCILKVEDRRNPGEIYFEYLHQLSLTSIIYWKNNEEIVGQSGCCDSVGYNTYNVKTKKTTLSIKSFDSFPDIKCDNETIYWAWMSINSTFFIAYYDKQNLYILKNTKGNPMDHTCSANKNKYADQIFTLKDIPIMIIGEDTLVIKNGNDLIDLFDLYDSNGE